jgi:hypothetical protein
MATILEDEKGRILLRMNSNGEFLVARYPDMTEETKEYLLKVYKEISNGDVNKLKRFINFEEDHEFCS